MGRHVICDIWVGGCVGKHLQRQKKSPTRVFNFSGFSVFRVSLLQCENSWGIFDSILSGAAGAYLLGVGI